MSVPDELSRDTRIRANGRCHYCRMHQSLQGATFHIEHVIPLCQNGRSEPANLVLACPGCNLRKSARIMVKDPLTGEEVHLFHPIQQRWSEHFRFDGFRIEGMTPTGRATVDALDLNHVRRQRIRAVEEAFGLHPPVD